MTVEEYLLEWRRWLHFGSILPDAPECMSVECRYRSPQVWDATPEGRKPPLRMWMGFQVERAVQKLPAEPREALRAEYATFRRENESEADYYERKRRIAQLPAWAYWLMLQRGKVELSVLLGLNDAIQ